MENSPEFRDGQEQDSSAAAFYEAAFGQEPTYRTDLASGSNLFNVENFDAALARIIEHGGQVDWTNHDEQPKIPNALGLRIYVAKCRDIEDKTFLIVSSVFLH
jgi:hypothetical protein